MSYISFFISNASKFQYFHHGFGYVISVFFITDVKISVRSVVHIHSTRYILVCIWFPITIEGNCLYDESRNQSEQPGENVGSSNRRL